VTRSSLSIAIPRPPISSNVSEDLSLKSLARMSCPRAREEEEAEAEEEKRARLGFFYFFTGMVIFSSRSLSLVIGRD